MNPPAQTGAPPNAKRPKKGNGVTSPSRRGGSGRVLTDVLVELGLRHARRDRRGDRAGQRQRRPRPSGCSSPTGRSATNQLARAVAERFGLDHLDLSRLPRRPRRGQARHPGRRQALPGRARSPSPATATLLVAMVDPANVLAVDDIAVMTGYEVRPAVASAARHRAAARAPRGPRLRQRRRRARPEDEERPRRRQRPDARARAARGPAVRPLATNAPIVFGAGGEDASVIQLVHRVIKEAVERGASDIHFEPGDDEMRVRYRIDGVLQEAATRAAAAPSRRSSRA